MMEEIQSEIKKLKPFHKKEYIKNIFSWKELENLLNLRPFNNQERFKVYLKERYEWPGQYWLSDVNAFPPSVIEQIIKKYLCHIKDASRVNEKINTICSQLDEITGLPTDAHIYFDLRNEPTKGFGIHYDLAHNLIIQIEGRSYARVWNIKSIDEKKNNVDHLQEKPIIDFIMEPGDVVYAPAYYYHEVHSIEKRLSISFPMWAAGGIPQERKWLKIKDGEIN